MGETAMIAGDLRERIIREPDVILDDHDLMRALVAANERTLGSNVVDMRGLAMARLEARLDQLERTHQGVIAAAYDNQSGASMIQRAVLQLLDATGVEQFLRDLSGPVADTLRVDRMRVVMETGASVPCGTGRFASVLCLLPEGSIDGYAADGQAKRSVTLRSCPDSAATIFGEDAARLSSEALLRLDLGTDRLSSMLALGSEDPDRFGPAQGTDLLAFFAGVLERTLRRWLT